MMKKAYGEVIKDFNISIQIKNLENVYDNFKEIGKSKLVKYSLQDSYNYV